MSKLLDTLYVVGILLVGIGGLLGVWWFGRDQIHSRSENYRGLIIAAAASLFILALVAQFVWITWWGHP